MPTTPALQLRFLVNFVMAFSFTFFAIFAITTFFCFLTFETVQINVIARSTIRAFVSVSAFFRGSVTFISVVSPTVNLLVV